MTRWIVHVVTPLAIGALIYVLWRPDHLQVFQWARLVGADGTVAWFRELAATWHPPGFVLFSLPGGLWAYSFASAMGIAFEGESRLVVALAMSVGPAIGVGSELAQAAGSLPGSFDAWDLVAYVLGGAFAPVVE